MKHQIWSQHTLRSLTTKSQAVCSALLDVIAVETSAARWDNMSCRVNVSLRVKGYARLRLCMGLEPGTLVLAQHCSNTEISRNRPSFRVIHHSVFEADSTHFRWRIDGCTGSPDNPGDLRSRDRWENRQRRVPGDYLYCCIVNMMVKLLLLAVFLLSTVSARDSANNKPDPSSHRHAVPIKEHKPFKSWVRPAWDKQNSPTNAFPWNNTAVPSWGPTNGTTPPPWNVTNLPPWGNWTNSTEIPPWNVTNLPPWGNWTNSTDLPSWNVTNLPPWGNWTNSTDLPSWNVTDLPPWGNWTNSTTDLPPWNNSTNDNHLKYGLKLARNVAQSLYEYLAYMVEESNTLVNSSRIA
ncbi:unnamed protein product [Timema podura]|uniref:Uncharacterized protein n=1 Tax=Timema podura TaxID=61482 RepID=A0ABN7NDS6_TIMPD|nr:unnamed protein product [Timema podura]